MHHIFITFCWWHCAKDVEQFGDDLIGVNWTLLPHDMHNRTHFSIVIFHIVGYGKFCASNFENKSWTIHSIIMCKFARAVWLLIRFVHIFTVELSLLRRYTWRMPTRWLVHQKSILKRTFVSNLVQRNTKNTVFPSQYILRFFVIYRNSCERGAYLLFTILGWNRFFC